MTLEPPALLQGPPSEPVRCSRLGIPHPSQDRFNPNPPLGGLFTFGSVHPIPKGYNSQIAEGQSIFST